MQIRAEQLSSADSSMALSAHTRNTRMGEGSYKSAPAAWKRAPTREAGRLEPCLQRGKTPPNPPSPHPCLFQPRGRSPQRPAQLRPRDPQGGSLLGEASFSLLESALRPQRGGWIDLLNGVGGDSEGCGGATRSHSLPRPLYWESLAELLCLPSLPMFCLSLLALRWKP